MLPHWAQSGPGSNGYEGVLCIHLSSSLAIRLFSVISKTFVGEVLSFCRKAVGVFYSPSQLGQKSPKQEPYYQM